MRYDLKGEHKLFVQLEEAVLEQFSHWKYKRAPDTMGAQRRSLRFTDGETEVLKYQFSDLGIHGPRGALEISLPKSETAVLLKALDSLLYNLSDDYASTRLLVLE